MESVLHFQDSCSQLFSPSSSVPSAVHAHVPTEEEGGGREDSTDGEPEERQLGQNRQTERKREKIDN